jgi:type II secretory pathway component HofQ
LVAAPARRKIDLNPAFQECLKMNEEALNMSLRKFLKVVGVTSQQEIEKAVRAAVADGRLKGSETITAQMVLTIGKIGLNHKVDGEIELG